MTGASAAIPADVARTAVEWLVTLQGDDVDDDTRTAWRSWLSQHPDHLRAWQHIEAMNARLRGVASPLATAVARAALTQPQSASRRRAINALAVLFVGGGTAWLTREYTGLQTLMADVHTAVGEQQLVTLDDGTRVRLNTDTAIDVAYSSTERRITLQRGEIQVETAVDSHALPRPFVVALRTATLRPLGTYFGVRQIPEGGWIGVTEGAVAVRPADNIAAERIIGAGQEAGFSSHEVDGPKSLAEAALAWTDGMLVATDMPLSKFLAEVDRYRPGHLRCDPSIASLRVSGTFPVMDTDRILDALRSALPVRIHFLTRYWTTVLPA